MKEDDDIPGHIKSTSIGPSLARQSCMFPPFDGSVTNHCFFFDSFVLLYQNAPCIMFFFLLLAWRWKAWCWGLCEESISMNINDPDVLEEFTLERLTLHFKNKHEETPKQEAKKCLLAIFVSYTLFHIR